MCVLLLIAFDAPFDIVQPVGEDTIVDGGDFSGGSLHRVEEALARLHTSVKAAEGGFLAGSDGQGGLAKDLAGARVLFYSPASAGFP